MRSILENDVSGNNKNGNLSITLEDVNDEFASNEYNETRIGFHGPFLDELVKLLEHDKIKLKVTIHKINWLGEFDALHSAHNIQLIDLRPRKLCQNDAILFDATRKISAKEGDFRVENSNNIRINISIFTYTEKPETRSEMAPGRADKNSKFYYPPPQELMSFMESILTKNFETDVVIISANGTQHPCHKIMLTSNSSVFEAMFTKDYYAESKTMSVTINDLSEEGVKAFLGYLYCLDVDDANKDFGIAMELLEASEKYGIERLKASMTNILLSNQSDWNEPEKALRLFCFSRNVLGCEKLKDVAVKVMKSFHEDLLNSEDYKILFAKNAAAAMDLCSEMMKM